MTVWTEMYEILADVGQAATEVECATEGCREFVSVYAAKSDQIIGFATRFPYLSGNEIVFRVIRFRVESRFIDNDLSVGPNDLLNKQEIYLPDESAVEFILGVWKILPSDMKSPRMVEIPV